VSIKVPFTFDMPQLSRGICEEAGMDAYFEDVVGLVWKDRMRLPSLAPVHMHVVLHGVNFGRMNLNNVSRQREKELRAQMRQTLEKDMLRESLKADMNKAGVALSFSVQLPWEYDAEAQELFDEIEQEAEDAGWEFFRERTSSRLDRNAGLFTDSYRWKTSR
jgi:Tfp pilus assembly protein PilO